MAKKFKVASAAKRVKTGFEPYDGPEITRAGVFRAVLKKLRYEIKSTGNHGFSTVFELEAAPGDPKGHAIYDGHPFFSRSIVTAMEDGSALKEGAQRNLDNFMHALGAKEDPEIILDDGDPDDKPVDVKKVSGKDPVGKVVNLEIQMRTYNGEPRAEIASIFAYDGDDEASSKKKRDRDVPPPPEDDEDDLLADMDEEQDASEEMEERRGELAKMKIAELKEIADGDYDLEIKGLKKDELVEAILDHEFEAAALSEEDESDEEDEESEEEDNEERLEELLELSRKKLEKKLLKLNPKAKIREKHSDEDLARKIIELEDDEQPF